MKNRKYGSPAEISAIVNLEKALDEQPFIGNSAEENPFGYGKDGTYLVGLLEQAGYALEAHQGGIAGTALILVPFRKPRHLIELARWKTEQSKTEI